MTSSPAIAGFFVSPYLFLHSSVIKKILLIITSILLITSTVFPQSKANVNSLKEYGGKAFKVDDDKPFTGRVFDLNKSTGKKKMEGQYKNGLKNGRWTYWYENRQKKEEGTYKDGKKDGAIAEWYESGQKKYEGTYKGVDGYGDSIKDGKWTDWYDNGQK